MNKAFEAIDASIKEVKKLRVVLKRKNDIQVRSQEECSLINATAQAWFNNHNKEVVRFNPEGLKELNQIYKKVLLATDRASTRKFYDDCIKSIIKALSEVRGQVIESSTHNPAPTNDDPLDFSPIAADSRMQAILADRWNECHRCIAGSAWLAATVMMGGFLEALLLARINKEQDKPKIFKAKTAPKDQKTGKAQELKDWTLRHYIDVAHELKWISESAKNVGEVLRDYRNYIHPYKQFSHSKVLTQGDASLFWEITKSISRQLLSL